MLHASADEITQQWVRNKSDKHAIQEGCWFDIVAGAWTVWWIERYCKLYEGEHAGEPALMRCGNPELDVAIHNDWEDEHGNPGPGQVKSIERAHKYMEWLKTEPEYVDWQYDCTMSVFGWQRYSERYKRPIRRFNESSIWIPKKQKKMLCLNTKVPTVDGWKTMGTLEPGDVLFDKTGAITRVIACHPVDLKPESYLVTFTNGQTVKACGDHLWETETLIIPKAKQNLGANQWTGGSREYCGSTTTRNGRKMGQYTSGVFSTDEIRETLKTSQGALSHRIRLHDGIDTPEKKFDLPPYFLGLWLGDGDSDCSRLTASDDDMKFYQPILESYGFVVTSQGKLRYGISGQKKRSQKTTPAAYLRKLGLFNNKHVPERYLWGSRNQRLELLQGLMDSDGCISKDGKCLTFLSTKQHLTEQVAKLLSSLGIKWSISKKRSKSQYGFECDSWQVQFHAFVDDHPAFKLPRKLERMRKRGQKTSTRSRYVHIKSIEPIEPVSMRCITVDSPSGTYLVGETMVATHNTPTNAAWSLYLTCGDGEQGGKTFGGAKDGNQAKIAADHAINMVEQSEELMAECKINKNESKIVHLESRSFYKPLSSNDSRHKDAKEGINGNIAIDETHVVDREFIEIISRAGISRSEPLLFDFSTAGKNPDGYGKERQDYVREVISGEKKNTRLFGRIYEVPQDTKDEDIKADPLKFGKMANPAWGHTANEDEFLADFEKSCRSVSAFAKFKMYRLNIWQHGASTWLQSDDWTKNAKDYSIEDFYGERVWLSLDMSKTQDMTSLAAMFKDDEEEPNYYQYPFVFLPKAYAIKHEKDVPMFMDWEKSGHLELIKGRIIRQKFIEEKMVWLDDKFDVQCLVYDTKFAVELVDFAEELGWECIPMEQNIGHYAKPTQTYEDLLADGRMRHPNHPVLDWQSRHCQVREDSKELKMPVKPDKKGFKKVDAIQGMVMALVGAVNEAGSGNRAGECYEDENFNWMSG